MAAAPLYEAEVREARRDYKRRKCTLSRGRRGPDDSLVERRIHTRDTLSHRRQQFMSEIMAGIIYTTS